MIPPERRGAPRPRPEHSTADRLSQNSPCHPRDDLAVHKLAYGLLIAAAPSLPLAAQDDSTAYRKSFLIPALEIVAFDAALNIFDRLVLGEPYHSSLSSIRRNLQRRWVTENDPFAINQLGHPYQGAIYHGFARSSGHDFWTSLGYTFAGSAMWEIAGETSAPSWNDQIASGIAGSFLGEALFRIANLVIETGSVPVSSRRRLISNATMPQYNFNRRVFGRRFDRVLDSRGAAYYRRVSLGASATTNTVNETGVALRPTEAILEVSMEYGLPGKDDYRYLRAFDYFSLQATATTGSGLESLLLHGLLVGREFGNGRTRGIGGLYGSYDYIEPQLFRVSSTTVSLGSTLEWRPSDGLAVQGTALAGAGFAAVGALTRRDTSDYHYGIAPSALVAARVVLGDRAAVDVSGREYYVSRVAGTNGHDNIIRVDAALGVRLGAQRALGMRYILTQRDAFFPDMGSRRQLRGTLGVFYTFLGNDRFGLQMQ